MSRPTKEKRERTQITNLRNERGGITIDPIDIKRTINEYYEQLSTHKIVCAILNEMYQFLEKHSLLKLKQEVHNLRRSISIREIKSIINNLLERKAPGPDVFIGEFYQIVKEEVIPIPYNHFQKIEVEETLPHSVTAELYYYPKPDKDITRKKVTYQDASLT